MASDAAAGLRFEQEAREGPGPLPKAGTSLPQPRSSVSVMGNLPTPGEMDSDVLRGGRWEAVGQGGGFSL